MRKRVVLALLLVVAMVVTSGCSLVVKDAEVDAQTPIITVVGQTFTKGEVNALVQNSLNYQASLYSMYGMTFDPTSESAISSAQESVINGLIEQAVVDAKMDELGIELTEEDFLVVDGAGQPCDGQRREQHHGALGEVEDAGSLEDQHEAQRDQRIEHAGQEAADQGFEEGAQHARSAQWLTPR